MTLGALQGHPRSLQELSGRVPRVPRSTPGAFGRAPEALWEASKSFRERFGRLQKLSEALKLAEHELFQASNASEEAKMEVENFAEPQNESPNRPRNLTFED